MDETSRMLRDAVGISSHEADIYLAALHSGPATLTELARATKLSRTIVGRPISNLVDGGLLTKKVVGKRVFYHPLNPQELVSFFAKKKEMVAHVAQLLHQQISAHEQDLQVRWFSGISGIQNAFREFFSKRSTGDFRHFENADTYNYVGEKFAEELMGLRLKTNRSNKVIVVGNPKQEEWYKKQLEKDKEQLRETVVLSEELYPFDANIAASENMVLIFEYKLKPFGLLIENRLVAESIRSIHKMVWERYRQT